MKDNIPTRKLSKYSKKIFKGVKLGDKVHSVAKPIAQSFDKIFGTEIEKCGACAKRREKLNNLFEEK